MQPHNRLVIGRPRYVVFAPTDEAFAKLPAGTIESLLKDKGKRMKILLYQVVQSNIMAKDVVKLMREDDTERRRDHVENPGRMLSRRQFRSKQEDET
jgi:uncharacterized surface protein with fasciclin (FAS1) repeats